MLGGYSAASLCDSKTHAKLASFAADFLSGIYPSTDFCLTFDGYENIFSVIPLSENSVSSGMKGIDLASSELHQFENLI
jgi:hypothetical protein